MRMPCAPNPVAAAFGRLMTPCVDAVYVAGRYRPMSADAEAVFTVAPPPLPGIVGPAAHAQESTSQDGTVSVRVVASGRLHGGQSRSAGGGGGLQVLVGGPGGQDAQPFVGG